MAETKTFYVQSNEIGNKFVNVDDITMKAIRLSELQALSSFKIAIIGDSFATKIHQQFKLFVEANNYCNLKLKCFGRGGLKINELYLDPRTRKNHVEHLEQWKPNLIVLSIGSNNIDCSTNSLVPASDTTTPFLNLI